MTLSKAKILAFLQPAISVVSGAIAAWLLVTVHVLGVFHVGQSDVAQIVASGIVFVITSALVWLSTHQHLVPITAAVKFGIAIPKSALTIASVIGFLSPYISVAAGALSAWLFVHVHFLGIFHVGQAGVAQAVASAVIFAVTAVLTWLAHNIHWLPLKYGKRTAVVVSSTDA